MEFMQRVTVSVRKDFRPSMGQKSAAIVKAKIFKKETGRHICNMRSADITKALMSELAELGYKVVI